MELYDEGASHKVFLCQSQRMYAFFSFLTRKPAHTQGLVLTAPGNIILSGPGMRSMAERSGGRPRHSRFEGSLAGAIAHEVAHMQVAATVGSRRVWSLPFWKNEGYAEYAANLAMIRSDGEYDLRRRVELLLDDDFWQPPLRPVDRRHFRWQVLVEYLCGEQEYGFEELIADSVIEESAMDELLLWYGG